MTKCMTYIRDLARIINLNKKQQFKSCIGENHANSVELSALFGT